MRKLLKFLFKRYIVSSVLLFLMAISFFVPIELTPYSYNYTSFGTIIEHKYEIEKLRDDPEVRGFLSSREYKMIMNLIDDSVKESESCNKLQPRLILKNFFNEYLIIDEFGCYEKEGVSYKINKRSFHILKYHFDTIFYERFIRIWPYEVWPFPKLNRDRFNKDAE